ncbi:hypothetical protein QBC38DRAFT_491646 [Podospora fimiseda]|uniref:Uncharacterized protein n=1 Tax=Podospora fimiseda TaxID=252190 RepID=A0AAN7BF29_9PEZI|nr:hypothetical protein QBC38DRAFT_491646 [Podospora fimiseda]
MVTTGSSKEPLHPHAAVLSRSSISVSTPILSNKSITVAAPSIHKPVKTKQLIPARIGAEQWVIYKETITNFLMVEQRTAAPAWRQWHERSISCCMFLGYGRMAGSSIKLGTNSFFGVTSTKARAPRTSCQICYGITL